MRLIIDALLPVFALIMLGYGLRRTLLREPVFWAGANKLSYFVLLPALLVNQLASARFQADLFTTLWGVVLSTMVIVTLLVWFTKDWLTATNGAFTSVLQGSIRPNTYVALALAAALYGQEGVVYTAILLAATVPLVNVVSVTALIRYPGDKGHRNQAPPAARVQLVFQSILQNPLIVACVIGLALNLTGIGAPQELASILTVIAQASLPLGLLTVGAGLTLTALHTAGRPLLSATIVKLVVSPAVGWLLCWLWHANTLLLAVCTIFLALPCATASYILAERMGGDHQLMAGILTVQTLVAGVTLPLLLWWLQ